MARRDSGKKAAKDGKTLRAAGKLAAAGARTTKKSAVARTRTATPPDSKERPLQRSRADEKWPLQRDVLFKPERLKYVRKQLKFEGCVFCEAAKRAEEAGDDREARKESLVLYLDDRVMVVMNKFPYNTGHLLVLPRRHEGELPELSSEETQVVFLMVQHCVEILKEAYEPAGFNVGLNLGAAAGAGIPEHLHTHIIPRWTGDTNFFPLIAQTKVIVETLEQTFDRLIPYFDK